MTCGAQKTRMDSLGGMVVYRQYEVELPFGTGVRYEKGWPHSLLGGGCS